MVVPKFIKRIIKTSIDFSWIFDSILGETNRHPKIYEFLDAILDAKKVVRPIFEGPPAGKCRVSGGNNRGYKDAKLAGESRTRAKEIQASI